VVLNPGRGLIPIGVIAIMVVSSGFLRKDKRKTLTSQGQEMVRRGARLSRKGTGKRHSFSGARKKRGR